MVRGVFHLCALRNAAISAWLVVWRYHGRRCLSLSLSAYRHSIAHSGTSTHTHARRTARHTRACIPHSIMYETKNAPRSSHLQHLVAWPRCACATRRCLHTPPRTSHSYISHRLSVMYAFSALCSANGLAYVLTGPIYIASVAAQH